MPYIYYMAIKRGDLVRWVSDHDMYEASGDVLIGVSPNYRHGIIIEVSVKDTNAVMVYCYDCNKKKESSWMILNMKLDELDILSGQSDG